MLQGWGGCQAPGPELGGGLPGGQQWAGPDVDQPDGTPARHQLRIRRVHAQPGQHPSQAIQILYTRSEKIWQHYLWFPLFRDQIVAQD